MTADSRAGRWMRAQSRRERALVKRHPKAVAVVCSVASFLLAAAMRSDGVVGSVSRIIAGSVFIVLVLVFAYLIVRGRGRAGETQDRIDRYLGERTRPPIRIDDPR